MDKGSEATPFAPDLSMTSQGYTYDLYLAVRGTDDRIYVYEFTRSAGRLGWESIPTGWTRLPLQLGVVDDKIYVIVTGGDNGLRRMDDCQGSNSWMEVVAKDTGKIAERTRTSLNSPHFFSFTLYAFSRIIKIPRILTKNF